MGKINWKDKFIEKDLIKGEEIKFSTRITKLIFLRALNPLIIALIVFVLSMNNIILNLFYIYSLLFFISFLYLIESFLKVYTSEIVLTNKRIVIKSGFIRRNVQEISLEKVESFTLNQNIFERFFNIGNIQVHGVGKLNIFINNIANPTEFKKRSFEVISGSEKLN